MLTLTPNATAHIATLLRAGQVLHIGLKKGGCAGMEYTMTILDAAPKNAQSITADGVQVSIDPLAEMFLLGTQLDYTQSLLESGFVFHNPNVKSACGCGESISF